MIKGRVLGVEEEGGRGSEPGGGVGGRGFGSGSDQGPHL